MSNASTQTILVTGATGFVASHIINHLLSSGYNVRGTVRSARSIEAVTKTHSAFQSQLSFATVSDMTAPNAFDEAVKDVDGVFHTASPFVLEPKDNETDLLIPAIKGTVGILESAARCNPKVKRIVITASFASILDLSQGYRPGYTYIESDWNPCSYSEAADSKTPGPVAYCASKALAEKAAWDWMDKHKPGFTLTTLCPPWIFGLSLGKIMDLEKLGESSEAIYKLINGTLKEVPPVDFGGFVDVRDIAVAHLLAFERDDAAGQRFIVGQHFDYQSAVDAILDQFPELSSRVPNGESGKGMKDVKEGNIYVIDGSRASRVLGIDYKPLSTTMKDMVTKFLETEKQLNKVY